MGNAPEAEKIRRIAEWKANSILIALIGMVGLVLSSYYSNRPTVDAPDRYTGTRGDAFENATKARFNTIEDAVDTIQLQIAALEYNSIRCREWRNEHSIEWHKHAEESKGIVNKVTNDVTRLQEKVRSLKELVDQCVPRN